MCVTLWPVLLSLVYSTATHQHCAHWVISILIPLEEDVSNFLIFLPTFICKSGEINRNGQIFCLFEIASWQKLASYPLKKALRQNQNIKKLEKSSFKGIYNWQNTVCVWSLPPLWPLHFHCGTFKVLHEGSNRDQAP